MSAEPIVCRQRIADLAQKAVIATYCPDWPPPDIADCPFPAESAAGMAYQAAFTRYTHEFLADEYTEGGA